MLAALQEWSGLPLENWLAHVRAVYREHKEELDSSPNEETAGAGTAAAATPEPAATKEVALELMEWDGVKKIIESHTGKVVVVDCWADG